MRILTIDSETHDPYFDRGLGSGWVFGLNVPSSDFRVLGFSLREHNGRVSYETDMGKVKDVLDNHDACIMHNASYDIGCLHTIGANIRDKPVFDTEVMSRLYNSSLPRHSLDILSKKYLKCINKLDSVLINSVQQNNLYDGSHKATLPKLLKWAKSHMSLIQEVDPNAVATYAIGDVQATYALYEYFLAHGVQESQTLKYSKLAHVCVDMRRRGVRIDLHRAREVNNELIPIVARKYQTVYDLAGTEFNLNSTDEKATIFEKLNIVIPRNALTPKERQAYSKRIAKLSEKKKIKQEDLDKIEDLKRKISLGKPTITSPWMQGNDHPICKAIVEAMAANKINKDFIESIIEMQQWTVPGQEDSTYGRIYPELHLLRARTGRFSCVPMSTKALTKRGWMYYDDLIIGEDILAYDMSTKTQKWTPLLAKNKVNSQVVGSFGTDGRRFRCTKDHKWAVLKGHDTTHNGITYVGKERLIEAGDIKRGHRVRINAPYESFSSQDINIYSTQKYSTDYEAMITRMSNQQLSSFVLGFLLADGHNAGPTKIGTLRGWQWTQARTVTREQLLTATYLEHAGRIGVGRHSHKIKETHTDTSRVTLCHSPFMAVSKIWEEETIEDVWCPTTVFGTWIMREGDLITITGNCSSPNIQQIPKRDPVYGPMCRSIFVPEEGELWFAPDFSNQEGRLFIHYANITKCDGIWEMVQEFHKDPNFDMHKHIAARTWDVPLEEVTSEQRSKAKSIFLGTIYGMGQVKLCKSLGLPTVFDYDRDGNIKEMAGPEGKDLMAKYNEFVPFLKQLAPDRADCLK